MAEHLKNVRIVVRLQLKANEPITDEIIDDWIEDCNYKFSDPVPNPVCKLFAYEIRGRVELGDKIID